MRTDPSLAFYHFISTVSGYFYANYLKRSRCKGGDCVPNGVYTQASPHTHWATGALVQLHDHRVADGINREVNTRSNR